MAEKEIIVQPGSIADEVARLKTNANLATGGFFQLKKELNDRTEAEAQERKKLEIGNSLFTGGFFQLKKEIAAREQAQKEVSRLNKERDMILNSASEGILGLDMKGVTIFVNPAGAKMLGYTVEELVGKSAKDIRHHGKSAAIATPKPNAKTKGPIFDKPRRVDTEDFWRKDGTSFPVEYASNPIMSEGRPIGVVITFTDITERKAAQDTLEKSEEKFRKIFTTSPDAIVISRVSDGVFVSVNEGFEALTGYRADEVEGKSAIKMEIWKNPKSRKIFVETLKKFGTIKNLEINFNAKGHEIQCLISASVIPIEGVPHVFAIIRDISDRVKAEQALKKSEEKFKKIFTTSPDAISITQFKDGKLIAVNNGFEELFGHKEKDVIGKSTLKLHIWKSPKERAKFIDLLKVRGRVQNYETTALGKKGEIWVLISASIIELEGLPYVLMVMRDISERKEAEKKLDESKNFLDKIINTMSDPVFVKDDQSRFVLVNDAEVALTGRSREEQMGKTNFESYPKDQVDTFLKNDREVLETGKESVNEEQLTDTSGKTLTIVTKKTRYTDAVGNKFIVGVIRDITERKVAEEAIKFKNIILQTQQETTLDGILVVDADGKMISFNQRYIEIWGIPKKVLDSKSDELALKFVLTKLADPEEFIAKVKYLYTHKEISNDEVLMKDGRVLERYSSPMLGEDKAYYGRVWYFRDITERKQAEAEVLEEEKKFRSLFESANDAIFIANVKTLQLVDCNARAEKLTGFSRKRLLSMLASELHPKDLVGATMKAFKEQVEGLRDIFETEVLTKDGKRIPVEVNSSSGIIINGNPCLVGYFRDISERKVAESKVKDLNELRNKLIQVISHQMRTPLTAMRWNLELILSEKLGKLPPGQHELVQSIYDMETEINKRLNDMLITLDIEEGRVIFSKAEFALDSLLESVMLSVKQRCAVKEIDVKFKIDASKSYVVNGDAEKIRMTMDQLLDNAIEYTKNKGKISIKLSRVKNRIRFEVTDTGIGIPKAEQSRLFNRFFRASNAFLVRPDASGLGLTIARYHIEQHEGEVGFKSKEGVGSTFWFELPALK